MAGSIDKDGLELATIFFGVFLGLFIFTMVKVVKQSLSIWKRTRDVWNGYLWMIWVEAVVNFVFAFTTYLFIRGVIPPSLGYYIIAVTLWAFQTQLLLQIIANRVGLIMVDRRKSRILKWALFVGIALVNISVYCIWIPGLMQISPFYVHLNIIWERVEKSIFLLVDLGLNLYFLYLVRSKLIARGLTKYNALFRFNAGMVVLSVCMDALLLGMLSLPNHYDYVQFSPVAYIVKLNIELLGAELISKVVRSAYRVDDKDSSDHYSNQGSHSGQLSRFDKSASAKKTQNSFFEGPNDLPHLNGKKATAHITTSECDQYQGEGILRTVVTFVERESEDQDECCSKTSEGHASSKPINPEGGSSIR